MYEAAILDMDGTIVDSVSTIERSLRETGKSFGVTITKQMVDAAKYSTNEQIYNLLGGGEKAELFMNAWGRHYHEQAKDTGMFSGMDKVLNVTMRRAIVTSETEEELLWNLERLGVPKMHFECLAGADTTEHVKPHPRPLLYCLEKMDLKPEDVIYIGDSLNDMRCCAAAGVDFALARFGAGEQDITDTKELAGLGFIGMKYILTRPEEILSLVRMS